jgi:hypothetical protein
MPNSSPLLRWGCDNVTWFNAFTAASQAPYDPLRAWAIVAGACALALAIAAMPLIWRALRSRSWRAARYGVILLDALALIAIATYAAQAWTSYHWFIVHRLPRSYPSRDVYQAYTRALTEALAQYQLGGWAIVGGTAALLIVGAVVAIKK